MNTSSSINCPNCGHIIDVNEVLHNQIESEYLSKLEEKTLQMESDYSNKQKEIEQLQLRIIADRHNLELQKQQIDAELAKRTAEAISREKEILQLEYQAREKTIRDQARTTIERENAEQLRTMQAELEDKSNKLKEMNRLSAELDRMRREKDELHDTLVAKYEAQTNERLLQQKNEIKRELENQQEMKFRDKDLLIERMQSQLKDMERKLEQGSMQSQGEVQELAIEEWLTSEFPWDTIQEIGKGMRGGDCLQIVNSRHRSNCGTIYYESKRTKNWSDDWIDKLKEDMIVKSANIGVIVTDAMPKGMERMDMRHGVWICRFDEFKGLSKVLREFILRISEANATHENMTDKMEMLYRYLTSNEFKMHLTGIVSGFEEMKSAIDREKRAMEKIWKEREKQIEKVLLNSSRFYGAIRGIAGNAIPWVEQLELPGYSDSQLFE